MRHAVGTPFPYLTSSRLPRLSVFAGASRSTSGNLYFKGRVGIRGKINADLCRGPTLLGARIVLLLTLIFGPSAAVFREGVEILTHQMPTTSRDHMLLARGAI